MSVEVSETSASIKSGKSTIDSPEDRDSGFHEDFDEALRSKQPSPDKIIYTTKNDKSHRREFTSSPETNTFSITPERAPLIPSEDRLRSVTLVDKGVVSKPLSIPDLGRTETFKETFSTNLFENTISSGAKQSTTPSLLSPKPVVAKGKVITAAEFEKLRQQAEEDSDDDCGVRRSGGYLGVAWDGAASNERPATPAGLSSDTWTPRVFCI